MRVEHNKERIGYLLKQYQLKKQEFLAKISIGLKQPITENDVFGSTIELNHLKRVDKLFDKGLNFYLDPATPKIDKEASIFFRKSSFQTDLNFEAKKIVNQYEDLKFRLSAFSKLSEIRVDRKFQVYRVTDSPSEIAADVRRLIYPKSRIRKQKDFLSHLIEKLSGFGVHVFEFVEHPSKREHANIDGFYLKPNVIVLKRHQKYFKREIFTLLHELGHHLLDQEEIEKLDEGFFSAKLNDVEKWCNDFAFSFLVGEYASYIDELGLASQHNDYHHETVDIIVKNSHLSRLAVFTRLLMKKKISRSSYQNVRDEVIQKIEERLAKEKAKLSEEEGRTIMSSPKPINSPLYIGTIQAAYHQGLINEYDVCKSLNIKPDKLSSVIG